MSAKHGKGGRRAVFVCMVDWDYASAVDAQVNCIDTSATIVLAAAKTFADGRSIGSRTMYCMQGDAAVAVVLSRSTLDKEADMTNALSTRSGPTPCRLRGHLTALCVLLITTICWTPEAVAQAARVGVTINSVSNRACIDQKFGFCGKADMMVRVALRQTDDTLVPCPDTTPIANVDNVGPLTSCVGVLVTTPLELVVTVFDVDEHQLPKVVLIESEIRLSQSGSGFALPFFRLNGTPQTINGPQANLTLTATVTPVLPAFGTAALQLSRTTIDPTLGDRTLASSNLVTAETPAFRYPSGARVRFSVQSPAGAVTDISTGVVPAAGFNLDWDGRINGQVVPAGTYQLQATLLDTSQVISAPIMVSSITNVFEIKRLTVDPWNARAGPESFAYRLSPQGTITRRIEGPSPVGSACTSGPLPVVIPDATGPFSAGNHTLTVPLTTPLGRFLPPGNYCVRFRANTVNGAQIGTQDAEINVIAPPALRLVASLSPAVPWILPSTTALDATGATVPVPAKPVFVDVRALDDNGMPRSTGKINVRATPFLIIPVPSAFITSQTCTGAATCRMQIGMATLTRATDVIFDADASDLPSTDAADPPPLTASFPQRGAALVWAPQDRAGPVSVPVIGDIASGFNDVDHNRVQDVAFHAGTGLDITTTAGATRLNGGIESILNVFFGGDALVGATTVTADRGRSVAFWLTRAPAVIDTEAAQSGFPGWPLCRRTNVQSVSFADMQAVIHGVNCRDNADWNHATFSAELGLGYLGYAMWHEFHHAAYDLADEYPPDGAYFETAILPNVMKNATDCAVYGAVPGLCAQIGRTGWWRAAPMPDVMVDNTRENLDESRLATWKQNICSTGGC